MFLQMSDERLKSLIRGAAHRFAAEKFKRANPRATEAESERHADRYWRDEVPTAIEWMATCDALEEIRPESN